MKILKYLLVLFTIFITQQILSQNMASWYGPGFEGKTTASGDIFSQNSFTCASPTLQFGTKLEITNCNNNKKVIVTVNDRGPYSCYKDTKTGKIKPHYPLKPHKTRILDLSKAAFMKIADINAGVIKIKYKILQ